jgi:hypothetical protein
MSVFASRQVAPAPAGGIVAGVLALGVVAVGLTTIGNTLPFSVPLAAAGGLALLGMLLLALAKYDAAVAVGFLLMGIVKVEPAPPDAAFAVIMAVAAVTGRFRFTRAPRIAGVLVAALLVLNVLSMMEAVHTGEAFRFFFITAYLGIFALWLTGWVDSRGHARSIVVMWLWIGTISAILGTAAVLLPLPGRELLLGDVASSGVGRATAFFKDPNVFGPFLIPVAVILLEERLAPRLLRLRSSTNALLFVVLSLGVLMSYSRAAWLNYVLSVVVMLIAVSVRRTGARQATRLLVSLAVVAVLLVGAITMTGSTSFFQERAKVQTYDSQRFGAQHLGYELSWSYPVGVGPGQFQYYSPVETHSTYIRVLAEQGFLGLSAWLAIILATGILAVRNVIRGRDTFGIGSAALLGIWAGLVLNSAVVDTLHWRHLWVVAALIWIGAMRKLDDAEPVPHEALPLAAPALLR